jgi:hypothetical protein
MTGESRGGRKLFDLPLFHPMTRKPRTPPETFASDEIFHYHLTELELIVASGKIRWTANSAREARRRLVAVIATIETSKILPVNGQ